MSIGNNHSTIMVRRKRAEKARIAVISREFRRHSGLLSRAKVHGMLAFSLGEGRRGKVRGLAGGGRSPPRTFLRGNSLLTGKLTGNLAKHFGLHCLERPALRTFRDSG